MIQGILPTMVRLGCLWNRSRLERYADGALETRADRSVRVHLDRCVACRAETDHLARLRALLHSALPNPGEPDWSGFWPAVRARIVGAAPRPVREPWWLPLWKPFWGHPRLALGGTLAGGLAVALALWPAGEGQVPAAWATPVLVQDVGMIDPDRSVMVYSSPEHDLTVIWLFTP
ncbi:MAG: zf-HC2 domain-containing protein, partial [Gemmatimonadales bacterium]